MAAFGANTPTVPRGGTYIEAAPPPRVVVFDAWDCVAIEIRIARADHDALGAFQKALRQARLDAIRAWKALRQTWFRRELPKDPRSYELRAASLPRLQDDPRTHWCVCLRSFTA